MGGDRGHRYPRAGRLSPPQRHPRLLPRCHSHQSAKKTLPAKKNEMATTSAKRRCPRATQSLLQGFAALVLHRTARVGLGLNSWVRLAAGSLVKRNVNPSRHHHHHQRMQRKSAVMAQRTGESLHSGLSSWQSSGEGGVVCSINSHPMPLSLSKVRIMITSP